MISTLKYDVGVVLATVYPSYLGYQGNPGYLGYIGYNLGIPICNRKQWYVNSLNYYYIYIYCISWNSIEIHYMNYKIK